MTEAAERVKAFCERVVTYEKAYREQREQEKGTLSDAEICGEDTSEKAIAEVRSGKPTENILLATSQQIRDDKIVFCGLLPRARCEVYELIKESNLTPLQRRIMVLRYNRAWTWKRIYRTVHLTKRRVLQIRIEAFIFMAPEMDRQFPNWQIGDE